MVRSDTNAPLRGITNISEYNEYIFSIFVNILDTIEDGALKGKQRYWLVDSLWVCFRTFVLCGFAREIRVSGSF